MSKIGKINISIPEKVKVALAGNIINIEGPLGKKSINVDLDMFNLDIIEGKEISIKPKKVELPSSNFKTKIADILKNEGFIKDFKVSSEEKKPMLSLELKYHSGNPVISAFERVSKPGRRIFSSADSLPKINNGLGIAIVSTPKGVMTDIDARKQKVGGEIICKVF